MIFKIPSPMNSPSFSHVFENEEAGKKKALLERATFAPLRPRNKIVTSTKRTLDKGIFAFQTARMSGRGSTGNVIAALASFFIPGLGQLIQGRPLPAVLFFCAAAIAWWFLLGWIFHLWAIIDAAIWKSR